MSMGPGLMLRISCDRFLRCARSGEAIREEMRAIRAHNPPTSSSCHPERVSAESRDLNAGEGIEPGTQIGAADVASPG